MKEIVTCLGLFIVLSVVFSGLTGCGSGDTGNGNAALTKAPGAVNQQTAESKPTAEGKGTQGGYPPILSGLAEADFELLDGTMTKISQRKGKVLLLNVWGIWCGPCRAEMPHLAEIEEKYREQGLEVIGLNIGDSNGQTESVDAIRKFAEQMKLNYTLAISPDPSTRQFYLQTRAQVVPQTILVDRTGHLRGVFIGGSPRVIESMKQTVEKTMNE